jgi:hypothetical protein
MIIEDAALRRVGGSHQTNYVKYGEWWSSSFFLADI